MVVLQNVHGVVGNIDGSVFIIVSLLHTRLDNAHHVKANPIDADRLSQSWNSRKQFVFGLRTDHYAESVALVVLIIQKPAFTHLQVPDIFNTRICAENREGKGTGSVLYR